MFFLSLISFIQKPVPFYLKLFPLYFICNLITELISEYLQQHGRVNTRVMNTWGTLEFCFYFFIIREVIVSLKAKRVILNIIFIFALFAFCNIILIQKKDGFNPVNFTIGSLITAVTCIYFFVELFQKVETPFLAKLPAFWISSGILFTTVLSFPMFALIAFLQAGPPLIFNNILAIFNIIMILTYLLYSIGFLCRIRIRKSTL